MIRNRYSEQEEALRAFLRHSRKAAGIRQADLAEKLGVPQSFISKYESGERLLTFLEAITIFHELSVSIEDAVSNIPKPSLHK